MSRRLSSEARRSQIVSTTLALLADTPVDRITTRQVAREVGISQPALFRHFRSRDDIFAAVVAHAREELAQLASVAVGRKQSAPLDSLDEMIRRLAEYVARNPGMPRLLFHDVGSGEEAATHRPLAQLVSMQRSIAAELVRQAQQSGDVSADVDPERAAALLVASLQGLLLQWQLAGRRAPLEREVASMLAFWVAAVRAGEPAREAAAEGEPAVEAGPGPAALPLVALDVRPLLEAGDDPLGEILATLRQLPPDGVMKLIAPFRPAPLLNLLTARDYRVKAHEFDPECWGVEVLGPAAPAIEDLRDLEPPEPLERILIAASALAPGEACAARVPRHPRLLLPRLEERGLHHQVYDEPDGTALVHVRRSK